MALRRGPPCWGRWAPQEPFFLWQLIILGGGQVLLQVVLCLLKPSKHNMPDLLHRLKLDSQNRLPPRPVPQVDFSALSYATDPIGQLQTEMVGEPWCNFLQHLLMHFAWCSPRWRLPARKMFRSILISVMSFATLVTSLMVLGTTLQWTNATCL